MAQLFKIVARNPNDVTGGGGCVCSESKSRDTQGPFATCPGNDMESIRSPHVVICAGCIDAMYEAVHNGEVLGGGEKMELLPGTDELVPAPKPRRRRPADDEDVQPI